MPCSAGDVLGLRATGKLTVGDYREALAPAVQTLLGRFDTLKVLFLLDEPFRGWGPRAAWANTVFDVKHRNHFDKVAVVGAPRWEQWCVNVAASLLMSGELRTYDRERLDAAWQWVRT
ncbi:STAS/SEC14 domain-containing protein [Mycobacterium interjectum]|nr:STAS/SEC14 domain-containing protein [Mycobacterium interjectum]